MEVKNGLEKKGYQFSKTGSGHFVWTSPYVMNVFVEDTLEGAVDMAFLDYERHKLDKENKDD